MLNINYVCLSDLHLGEEDSLLTDFEDVSRPSPVLQQLAECLAELLRQNQPGVKPTLVLAGDVLDLALCAVPQTLATFEQFIRTMMPSGGELFRDIIYVPGNHDHHMWQSAREAQYLNYLAGLDAGSTIQPPWDTTKAMPDLAGKDRLVSGMATAVARRLPHLAKRGFEVLTAYPHFGKRDNNRAVIFHHGHFIEPAYRFFSTLASLFFPEQPPPPDVYTLEKENSAWIDFFWSTMGSCGRIGADVETIYEASADEQRLHCLTDTLAHSIAMKYPVPEWAPRALREWVLRAVLNEAAKGMAKGLERRPAGSDAMLGPEAAQGLRWYITEMIRRQLEQETGFRPESLTLVFGHTHKPFVELRDSDRILNTGGWVVDTPEPQPLHGASAVLVSEDLSAVAIRWYNEGTYAVRVEEPAEAGAKYSPFCEAIANVVAKQAQPWKSFSETTRTEVQLRAEKFASRLKTRAAAAA
ncbi:MAG: metallophosphoesterase [Bryobacteraceae bacterium]